MIIRPLVLEDISIVKEMNENQGDFKIKHFNSPIIDRIVFDNDNTPIAYGIVKRMAEAIMIVNTNAPLITRAKAMRELMQFAEFGAVNHGCDQLHCFVSNRQLADTLIKHYGFIPSADIVLVKNL